MYSEGSMLWLPPKQDIPHEHSTATEALDDGCFNHPVLVLATDYTRNEAVVFIITSFGGKDLQERHPKSSRVRAHYLPIYPSKEHPENGMRLFLADNERLFKNSYVTTKPCRTIKVALLRRWRNGKYKLREDSLRELLEYTNFQSPWPKTIQPPSPISTPQQVPYTLPDWVNQFVPRPATIPSSVQTQSPVRYNVTPEATQQRPLRPTATPASRYIPSYTINPPARSARPDYQHPVQWSSPSYTYVRHERAPLLHSSHQYESPSTSGDEGSSCGDFARVVVVIGVIIGAAWYFKMF